MDTTLATTLDGLLNKKVKLEQPKDGYRVALDTVFLASAVDAKANDLVLDLGCGVGGSMLSLAARVSGLSITGIDCQEELLSLCVKNIELNAFPSKITAMLGDARKLPNNFKGVFNQVLMNPPYHEEEKHSVSEYAQRRTANTEKPGDLSLWIKSAAEALQMGGFLTLIHRADREKDILPALTTSFGETAVLRLVSKEGVNPKRVIIRAQKGGAVRVRECPDFLLHQKDGNYTLEAEDILRQAKGLVF